MQTMIIIYCETAEDCRKMVDDHYDCNMVIENRKGETDIDLMRQFDKLSRSLWAYFPELKLIEFLSQLDERQDFDTIELVRYDRVPK